MNPQLWLAVLYHLVQRVLLLLTPDCFHRGSRHDFYCGVGMSSTFMLLINMCTLLTAAKYRGVHRFYLHWIWVDTYVKAFIYNITRIRYICLIVGMYICVAKYQWCQLPFLWFQVSPCGPSCREQTKYLEWESTEIHHQTGPSVCQTGTNGEVFGQNHRTPAATGHMAEGERGLNITQIYTDTRTVWFRIYLFFYFFFKFGWVPKTFPEYLNLL